MKSSFRSVFAPPAEVNCASPSRNVSQYFSYSAYSLRSMTVVFPVPERPMRRTLFWCCALRSQYRSLRAISSSDMRNQYSPDSRLVGFFIIAFTRPWFIS